jgi:hypothetical protein
MEYVDPVWYNIKNMVKLTRYLQSSDARKLTREIAIKIVHLKGWSIKVEKAVDLFLEEWIKTAQSFVDEVYSDLEDEIKEHAYKFPLIVWPKRSYMSFEGRKMNERVLDFLRKIPGIRKYFIPREITDPVPKIIIPGVDYSAESLVFTRSLLSRTCAFDKARLEWMHRDARADYAKDVVCFGCEDFETLAKAWFYGEVDSWHAYIEALSTLVEEALHHMVDHIVWISRYGVDDSKEHYWMNAYGDFPEKVYDAIEKHSEKYMRIIRRKML